MWKLCALALTTSWKNWAKQGQVGLAGHPEHEVNGLMSNEGFRLVQERMIRMHR